MAMAFTKTKLFAALALLALGSARSELRQRQLQRDRNDLRVDTAANSTRASSPTFVLSQPQAVVHVLAICNAYAHVKPLNVYRRGASEKLTGDRPLGYKECRELTLPLEGRERLEFRVESMLVGTFDTNKLPPSSTSLLLIPHRREPSSLAAVFDSHAFSSLQAPQVALVDAAARAGGGAAAASRVQIADQGWSAQPGRVEDLKFNSVIALKPGKYKLMLAGLNNQTLSSAALQVGERSKNVVMRVGTSDDGRNGSKAYPEELIVFSQRSADLQGDQAQVLQSAAAAALGRRHSSLLSLLAAGFVGIRAQMGS